ncbi:LysR substrate-binding domain-containing protein [Acinetobacter larvae]|uniref:HTH lysR-type domain-containing protein n=1 Tax=Acinetobacter larvae TaxID=1789224 RepID=A0A1B2LYY7_9GAMM|nr:LysR substrate-binding domain-containing protein [Acinetobacter larvae]AOA58145.1 hypothetical protein BFG52_07110 [Acinetobacter larvae]
MKRRHLPPLNALRMFEAVARHRSLSLAAEELCVTHSAVSHQIKILEQWFEQKLFTRHAHGVALTHAGLQLFTVCVQSFNDLENCIAQLAQHNAPNSISIGAPHSFLANWLIARLEHFELEHRDIQIKLMTCNDIKALEKDQIDIYIANQARDEAIATHLQRHLLFEDKIGPVSNLEKIALLHHPKDLLNQTLLHTKSNPEAWSLWLQQHNIQLEQVKQQRSFDHLNLMLEAAASGLGIAIAPQLLLSKELENQRLYAPLGFMPCGRDFYSIVKKSKASQTHIQQFMQWLHTAVIKT